ncbi:MAG: hypothetical protein L6Q60_14125 [Rhodocyclaceae bacterium]|nr:hypothetical protein [Rhodocyclaceae bacterium]
MNAIQLLVISTSAAATLLLSGCQATVGMAGASAEAQQQPEVFAYSSTKSPSASHTAAAQAMASFGTLTISDKDSGIVQGKKGNWLTNVAISGAGKGSRIEISLRYVSSKQMDLNSKSSLLADYTALLEKSLHEKLVQSAK